MKRSEAGELIRAHHCVANACHSLMLALRVVIAHGPATWCHAQEALANADFWADQAFGKLELLELLEHVHWLVDLPGGSRVLCGESSDGRTLHVELVRPDVVTCIVCRGELEHRRKAMS